MARPRFQFRLRTLMIAVTVVAVVCGVCGYVRQQAKIVRERNEVLAEIDADALSSSHVGMMIDAWSLRPGGYLQEVREGRGIVPTTVNDSISPKRPWDKPSALHRWLGDSDMKVLRAVCVSADADENEIDRLHSLFPEAEIYRVDQTSGQEKTTRVR